MLAILSHALTVSNPTLKFAPFGRWDAPLARPLAGQILEVIHDRPPQAGDLQWQDDAEFGNQPT